MFNLGFHPSRTYFCNRYSKLSLSSKTFYNSMNRRDKSIHLCIYCPYFFFLVVLIVELILTLVGILDHLSQCVIPFCIGYFVDKILFYAWDSLDVMFIFVYPCIARMIGAYHPTQSLVEIGSCELFAQTDLKLWAPNFYIPSS
jgi:hypothetical protein